MLKPIQAYQHKLTSDELLVLSSKNQQLTTRHPEETRSVVGGSYSPDQLSKPIPESPSPSDTSPRRS